MNRQGLYFIRNPVSGNIKIGITGNLRSRISGLEHAAGVRLETLGWVEGAGEFEERLHLAFAEYRTVGEWFTPSKGLIALAMSATRDGIVRFLASNGDRIAQREVAKRAAIEASMNERTAARLVAKAEAKAAREREARKELQRLQRVERKRAREAAEREVAQAQWREGAVNPNAQLIACNGPAISTKPKTQRDRNLHQIGLK